MLAVDSASFSLVEAYNIRHRGSRLRKSYDDSSRSGNPQMAEPLSIAAGVVGVLTAAAQISSLLIRFTRSIKDAPARVRHVITEVNDVSGILIQLQSFLLGKELVSRSRSALLQVDQVVMIVSGCVMTFSELEKLLDGLKVEGMDVLDRVRWITKEPEIVVLIQGLQNHKASLSLMLNVLNGETIMEAKDSVDRLYNLVEESYQEMSSRLQALELREQQGMNCASSVLSNIEDPPTPAVMTTCQQGAGVAPITNMSLITFDFSEELQNSRVYRKTSAKRTSTFSTDQCTMTWSCFSGISLAEVSNISVIDLVVPREEIYGDYPTLAVKDHEAGWQIEAPEVLEEAAGNLRVRILDWYSFDFEKFGKLQLFGTLRVSTNERGRQTLECFLFETIFICTKGTRGAIPQDESGNTERKVTLKGWILLLKYLTHVISSLDRPVLTLYLSVQELPKLHLQFETQAQVNRFKLFLEMIKFAALATI